MTALSTSAGPLVTSQEAELTPEDAATDWSSCGWSVALSGDGSTALLGAWYGDAGSQTNAGSAYVFVRSVRNWIQQAKLTAADAARYDNSGNSVAISADGNTALVGANLSDPSSLTNAGSAYVFVRTNGSWSQQAKLTAADAASGDEFGYAVGLSGDGNTALVGAWHDDTTAGTDAGSAYVFVRSGSSWSQQTQLKATPGRGIAYFGSYVCLSEDGSRALITAIQDSAPGGPGAGSAYVFARSGGSWAQQAKLAASDGTAFDYFGTSVCLSSNGTTALVGANLDNTPAGAWAGSAYVFAWNGSSWSQQAKLTASDGTTNDFFGWSAALSRDGDRALVGANYKNTPAGSQAGSAYVFGRSGTNWSEQARLAAKDAAAHLYFGTWGSLSGDGGMALVGASQSEPPNAVLGSGRGYVFGLGAGIYDYNRIAAEILGVGDVRLTYLGLAGTNCALDRTFDLAPTVAWVPQVTNAADASGWLVITNTPDPGTNNFWRVRLVP